MLIFDLISLEYDIVFKEIVHGVLTTIPVRGEKVKGVFAVETTGNWGLCTGKARKDKRPGDTTTLNRLKKLADLGLFCEKDFKAYKGELHKDVLYNSSDAKYIMLYLYDRVKCHFPALDTSYSEDVEPGGIEYGASEGALLQVVVNRYERNTCICDQFKAIRGTPFLCDVCGFNFESVYGELGKEYIQVHHKIPLYKIGRSYQPNIRQDFAMVCPNCHAMLHKDRKNPLTIDELKAITQVSQVTNR